MNINNLKNQGFLELKVHGKKNIKKNKEFING